MSNCGRTTEIQVILFEACKFQITYFVNRNHVDTTLVTLTGRRNWNLGARKGICGIRGSAGLGTPGIMVE